MARIVAGVGVPHTVPYPELVRRKGPDWEVAILYERVAAHLRAASPSLLICFVCDHLNTFFLDNWPTFAIGVVAQATGPNDEVPMVPQQAIPVAEDRARDLHAAVLEAGFDLSLCRELQVDHSVMVPLHFLTPDMTTPIIPVFVNGLVPPLPSARRCFLLGRAVGQAVAAWPEQVRVAVLASGSFSLEVGGPRIDQGRLYGIPDLAWAKRVTRYLQDGMIHQLLDEATPDRIAKAGNAAGELLAWMAMVGAVGDLAPRSVELEPGNGHAFGTWGEDSA